MAEGKCIYSGSVDNLIPYLSVEGFYCPTTYSPADYSEYSTYKCVGVEMLED